MLSDRRVGNRPPSYARVLGLLLLARLLLSFGTHLSASLFSTFTIENMGLPYGDTVAVFTFHGVVAFAMSTISSSAIDRLPIIPIVGVACIVGAIYRTCVAFFGSAAPRLVQLLFLCVALPTSDAIFRAPLLVFLKRVLAREYANDEALENERRAQFVSCFYVLHNIGDIIANAVYYELRLHSKDVTTANVVVVYIAAGVLLVAVLLLGVIGILAKQADRPSTEMLYPGAFRATFFNRDFVRFFLTVLAVTCITSMFQHFDLTMTKHLLVEMGPKNPFPLLQSINPVIVTILTPLAPMIFSRMSMETYDVLAIGTGVSSLGCIAIGLLLFPPLAVPLQTALSVGLCIFSVGEAIWSPRIADYALELAPDGFEAVYQAIADLPKILLIFFSPILSNLLITSNCTANHCDGFRIWASLAIVASISPIVLLGTRPWLRVANRVYKKRVNYV